MLPLIPRFAVSAQLPTDLQDFANNNPTLARIYAGRGITTLDELNTELLGLLPASDLFGIDEAVALLDTALDAGKRILIVGDFDCDGATSTALMLKVLSSMGEATGASIDFVVPDRFKYGYGLTPEIVELGIREYHPDMIVTVDNGISSHEGVKKAQEHGIQVIITDHHLTTKTPPPAEAVVNPNQLSCNFASKSLVGVGVAFYVLGRLAKVRRSLGKSTYQVSRHLDLVALGTVADVGTLDKNNRILVHHGLHAIRAGRCSLGILALLEQAGRDHKKLSTQDFGFVIAPRINAAGRMDSMDIGIECLLSEEWGEAQTMARQLDTLNKDRRSVEGKMRDEADAILARFNTEKNINKENINGENEENIEENTINDTPTTIEENLDTDIVEGTADKQDETTTTTPEATMVQAIGKRSLVLYQDNWHQGVIGIVAGRLKESHYRPAIVFAPADSNKTGEDDIIKGSARSISGIHVRDVIEQVAETHPTLISHFGGHAMAAGLTIKRRNFEVFAQAFDEMIADVDASIFTEDTFTDGQLTGQDFSLIFVEHLQESTMWGHGFVAPMFDGVFTVMSFKVLKDKHLKLSVKYPDVQYPIDAICFNYDSDAWDYRASSVHLLFELDINEWNGRQNIQLMVRDFSVVATS